MALSETATRMLATLPAYYEGEPLVERVIQAWANEIDRIDARLDAIKSGLVPTLADDTTGLLAIWEFILGLPVAPAATVGQRQTQVSAALRQLDSTSSADYVDVLDAAFGGASWELDRDTPDPLEDTLELSLDPDTYAGAQAIAKARRMHPAHRLLLVHSATGFLLDHSLLDQDSL